MKVCVAGEGAQGLTHLQALRTFSDIEVASLAGGIAIDTETFAKEWNIAHWSLDFSACISQPDIGRHLCSRIKSTAQAIGQWKQENTCY